MNRIPLLAVLLFSFVSVAGQSLYPVDLNEKVTNSSLIIEGKVIAQQPFWNPEHSFIMTDNQVEVYKVFKGKALQRTIHIITAGGSLDGYVFHASDLLSLETGTVGTFFCNPNKSGMLSPLSGTVLWDVYSSAQGCYKYDLYQQAAAAPFVRVPSITSLYATLAMKVGNGFETIDPSFKVEDFGQLPNQPTAPLITDFSPTTVNAGTLSDPANSAVLTINGSGFGTATGSAAVRFDDANDGSGGTPFSVAANSQLIISWTDTQIKLKTPASAGTGKIEVIDANGVITQSATNLTVLYSVLNSTVTSGSSSYLKEFNLMNANGAGGYNLLYSISTAGSGINIDTSIAKTTFQRALKTWKENLGANLTEAGTTTVQAVTNDGINIIVFDNQNAGTNITPLPAGVLAVCYSFGSICNPASTNGLQKSGFDIVIRNSAVSSGTVQFNYGPCPPMSSNFLELDMETVLFHELGHALNLGHINDDIEGSSAGRLNPAKIMNYSITNSVKRVSPDYSARTGAVYCLTPKGNSYGNCGAAGEMSRLTPITLALDDCPTVFPATSAASNTSLSIDLEHAGSNKFSDPLYTKVRTDGIGVAITNNVFYALKTNNIGGVVTWVVNNYTNSPVTPTTCPTPYGYLTKGVELSLYQVNTCPASGSAYPTPIYYGTFNGNTTLNSPSLAANTTYLMMIDGIENTKSTFDLVFTGVALPYQVKDFRGIVQSCCNRLEWELEVPEGYEELNLERSSNGVEYRSIFQTPIRSAEVRSYFNDKDFTGVNSYYRIKLRSPDGREMISSVVSLKRTMGIPVKVFPNPASGYIWVDLRMMTIPRSLMLVLRDMQGRTVMEYTLGSQDVSGLVRLPVALLQNGYYQLMVYDADRRILGSENLLIRHP